MIPTMLLLGKITSKSKGIKYEIIEKVTLCYRGLGAIPNRPQIDAYGTLWEARPKTKDFPLVVLFVTTGELTGNDIDNFKKLLLSAFKQALFYDMINENSENVTKKGDYLEIEFEVDNLGNNLFKFRIERADNTIEFKYDEEPYFQRELILTAELEILEELHKKYQIGIDKKDLYECLFFDEAIVNDAIKELMENQEIEIKENEKIYIMRNGEDLRKQLIIDLGRVTENQNKQRIGF